MDSEIKDSQSHQNQKIGDRVDAVDPHFPTQDGVVCGLMLPLGKSNLELTFKLPPEMTSIYEWAWVQILIALSLILIFYLK